MIETDCYLFDSKIAFLISPKVGTRSLLRFLWLLSGGESSAAECEWNHSSSFAKAIYKPVSEVMNLHCPIVAIHRCPYERIRSAYQHRVLEENEIRCRSFRDFCQRLAYFRGVHPGIAWHTASQVKWLGKDHEVFNAAIPLSRLQELPALVGRLTDINTDGIGMAHEHRMRDKPEWEKGLRELLEPWVRDDLAAGWDGESEHYHESPSRPTVKSVDLTRYRDDKTWGWYRMVPEMWQQIVATAEKARALEIGAFDGVSANVMLDAIFTHPESVVHTIDPFQVDTTTPQVDDGTKALFKENCLRGGHGDRIRLFEGYSDHWLAWMMAKGSDWENYDVIFIDGSHLGRDVISDAAMGWRLLKPGGLLIFDDYEWGPQNQPWERPREAIDAFALLFAGEAQFIHGGWQRVYRKTKSSM